MKIKEDLKFANDKINNNNKIEEVLLFKFTLKIFKLVILILNSSYLLGMLWLVWCQFIADFILDADFENDAESHSSHFIT